MSHLLNLKGYDILQSGIDSLLGIHISSLGLIERLVPMQLKSQPKFSGSSFI